MAKKKQQRPDVPRPQLQNTSNVDTDVFVKGMAKDQDIALTGKENWTHCINCINNSAKGDAGTIGNEPANLPCSQPPYTIIGGIHLYGDKWVLYSTDDTSSEIGLFDDSKCEYETLVNDDCLNFNKRYLITGASKESFECQWWVYWDDGINPSRALNIADIPWKQNQVTGPEIDGSDCVTYEDAIPRELDCERIRLNPIIDIPCVKLSKAKDGGQLQNGSYEAYIAYVIDDNKVTDYYKSNIQSLWDHQDNAGSLDIDIEGLDKQFESYQLVIYTNAGMNPYAVVVGTYSTEQSHINLDSIDMSASSPGLIDQLPLYTPVFERSEKMYSVNDYLLRQAPTTDFDFNYQCKANDIGVSWISTAYSSDYYIKGGNKTTFMRDEQYSFFIRFVYNTGNKSSSYHIPGRQADAVDTGAPADLAQVLNNEAGFPNWQINNTATETANIITSPGFENIGATTDDGGTIVAKGQMGYWESTELYPNNPTVWCDNCGTPVRHHKMPEEATSPYTRRSSDNNQFIYILGAEFDNIQLPEDEQGVIIPNIVGYEILVGSRQGNKSIIAKGLARNMRAYNIQSAQGTRGVADAESPTGNIQGLMPNYPFNDLGRDPYLSQQEVIRQGDYMGYDGNFTRHDIFTFHSPETSFDRPFLNPTEIKSYGVTGGFSLGRFKRSEEHPKHKLIRDIAAIIAAIIGAGYAIMEMRGEKVQKVKGATSLSIGKDPGPYADEDREAFTDNSTINTTSGTGGTAWSGFGFSGSSGGTGGVANVNMNVSDDPDGDGFNNATQDISQVTPVTPPGSVVPGATVNGGGAAPGMSGNITVQDPNIVNPLVADGDPNAYIITFNNNTSQAQINASENVQQFGAAQNVQQNVTSTNVGGQEGASGALSTSNSSLTQLFTGAFTTNQEQEFAMSTTPIGDATNALSVIGGGGGIGAAAPSSVSGAEEDFLHDIKQKNDNAAMQTPGHIGSSREVEMKGTKYKSLPGFLQMMFKAYTFLNLMSTGGQNIIDMIYELMEYQDYAYKYNSYGLYTYQNNPQGGQRHRIEVERCRYLSSAFQNLGTNFKINNLHRPKTVILQGLEGDATGSLVDPTTASAGFWRDNSKFVLGELPTWMVQNPTTPLTSRISAHYVGLKFRIDNQYGQIQGIRQLPAACTENFRNATNDESLNQIVCTNCTDDQTVFDDTNRFRTSVVFGGDCYLNRYSEKVIMPFFWDFLKGEPDDYFFDYRLHQNVPFVRFWYSAAKYELSGLVRPITDLSFSWLSNPNDPGLPSALHNLDRLGSDLQGNAVGDVDNLGSTTGLQDDWAMSQAEVTSNTYGVTPGTGWASGSTGGATFTGGTDTSGNTLSQNNANWLSSGGQATKSNGIFTIRNAFCYLHNSGINEFYVESELNMAQRDWDDKPEARHYDWQEFTDVNALFHADIIKDGNFYKFDRSLMWKNLASNLLSYGFVQPLSYDPTIAAECMTHYPKRIMYSLKAQDEAKKDFWRIFLPFNKEDFKEPVTTIKPINKTGAMILFPHRAPQMWQGVDTLQTEGNVKVTIGDGGLFSGPRQNITNADLPHEYASCESMRSVINTPSGAYFISQAQGKIFNYTGGLENIADRGMKQWFNTYLPSRLLAQFPEMEGYVDADNPVVGIGTQSVYDPNYDLVYFMKKDYELCDDSGCIQYDPIEGFVYNATLCDGAEQILTCPEGYQLFEVGEISPLTGEVLEEATCCAVTTDSGQNVLPATLDCGDVNIDIPTFELIDSTITKTKNPKYTVVFEIPDSFFETVSADKTPKNLTIDIPFVGGGRQKLSLKRSKAYSKNYHVILKTKKEERKIPYTPTVLTYKALHVDIIDGKQRKTRGIVGIKDNKLTGVLTRDGNSYEITKVDGNKYALYNISNAIEQSTFECVEEFANGHDDRPAPGTRVRSSRSGANTTYCAQLTHVIDWVTYNESFNQSYADTVDWAILITAACDEIYQDQLNMSITAAFTYIFADADSCVFDEFTSVEASDTANCLTAFREFVNSDNSPLNSQAYGDQYYTVASLFSTKLRGGRSYTNGACTTAGNSQSQTETMKLNVCGFSENTAVQGQSTMYDIEDGWVNSSVSWLLKIASHEIGHSFGARHTHHCGGGVDYYTEDGTLGFSGGKIDICGDVALAIAYDDCPYDPENLTNFDTCMLNQIEYSDDGNICWPNPAPTPILDNLFATNLGYGTIMSYCGNVNRFTGDNDLVPFAFEFHPILKDIQNQYMTFMLDVMTEINPGTGLPANTNYDNGCLSCDVEVNEEETTCDETVRLVIGLNSSNISIVSYWDIQELVQYMNTGDSGNTSTQISIVQGNSSLSQNLPITFDNGESTSDYGVNNLNDLLVALVSQNNITDLNLDAALIPEGENVEIYWAANGMGNIDPEDVLTGPEINALIANCPFDNSTDNGNTNDDEWDCECVCEDGFNLVNSNTGDPATADDCQGETLITLEEVDIVNCGTSSGGVDNNTLYVQNPSFDRPGGYANGDTPDPWLECFRGSRCSFPASFDNPYNGAPAGTWIFGYQNHSNCNDTPCPELVQTPDTREFGDPMGCQLVSSDGDTHLGLLHSFARTQFYNDNCDDWEDLGCLDVCCACDMSCGYEENWPYGLYTQTYTNEGNWQEGVAQPLTDASGTPINMDVGTVYTGTIDLAQPERYDGGSCFGESLSAERPGEIQIWGGTGPCLARVNMADGYDDLYPNSAYPYVNEYSPDSELLWSSGDISQGGTVLDQWTTFTYTLAPTEAWSWLLIKVNSLVPCDHQADAEFNCVGADSQKSDVYVFVDNFSLPERQQIQCCECPPGFEMVLNDGEYGTPVSTSDCIKDYNDNSYIDYSDGFDVICVQKDIQIGDVECVQEWSVTEGSCEEPSYSDDILPVLLTDEQYFKDVSWTASYDPKIKGWISFHDWHPELSFPSLNHFLTTKTQVFDDPLCPDGYTLNDLGECERENFVELEAVSLPTIVPCQNFITETTVTEAAPVDIIISVDTSASTDGWGNMNSSDQNVYWALEANGEVPTVLKEQVKFVNYLMEAFTPFMESGDIQVGLRSWSGDSTQVLYQTDEYGIPTYGSRNVTNPDLYGNTFAQDSDVPSMTDQPWEVNQDNFYLYMDGTDILNAGITPAYNQLMDMNNSVLGNRSDQPGYRRIIILVTDMDSNNDELNDNSCSLLNGVDGVEIYCILVNKEGNCVDELDTGIDPWGVPGILKIAGYCCGGSCENAWAQYNDPTIPRRAYSFGPGYVWPANGYGVFPQSANAENEYDGIWFLDYANDDDYSFWSLINENSIAAFNSFFNTWYANGNAGGGNPLGFYTSGYDFLNDLQGDANSQNNYTVQQTVGSCIDPFLIATDVMNTINLQTYITTCDCPEGMFQYGSPDPTSPDYPAWCVQVEYRCPPEGQVGLGYEFLESYNTVTGQEPNYTSPNYAPDDSEWGVTFSSSGPAGSYVTVDPDPIMCQYSYLEYANPLFERGGMWRHNVRCDLFTNYYTTQYGWEIEMVESVGQTVNTLRSIEYEMEAYLYKQITDYQGQAECGFSTNLHEHIDCTTRWHDLDHNFNRSYIYNTEQVSGNLHLNMSPKNNAPEINLYPQINIDAANNENSFIDILYDKEEQKYRFNQFWDITRNRGEIISPTGNFDSNATLVQQSIIFTELNGYVRKLNSLNLDYDKPPHQRKKFRHYWNKIVLAREPVFDPDRNEIIPETRKMLLKLDNAKINVSFR